MTLNYGNYGIFLIGNVGLYHQPYPYSSTLMEALIDPFKGSLNGTLKGDPK